MQKGFIALPILALIILGLTVVVGGGYAAYKYKKLEAQNAQAISEIQDKMRQNATTTPQPTISTSTEPVATTSSEAQFSAPMPESKKTISISNVTIPQSQATISQTDFCPNIEGIQTGVPNGFSLMGGSCIPAEDKCFNLDGYQASIPSGMIVYKGYGCMTEKQMDQILDAKTAQNSKDTQCKALSAEILDMKAKYQAYYDETEATIAKMKAAGGGLASGVNAEISNYIAQRDPVMRKMSDDINAKTTEYNMTCL